MLPDSFFSILKGYFSESDRRLIRKLSIKDDKESKSRVFGILDYWSQAALKPLHDHVFKILKTNPKLQKVDATFNQDKGFSNIPDSQVFYSFDLSSATDRMPIKLQQYVVTYLYGDKLLADCWRDILVKEPYYLKGDWIYYRSGQPMGAYSS